MASPPDSPARADRRASRSLAIRIGLVALVGFSTAVASTVWRGLPTPSIQDEYSYLLAADTFLHGRLANPPHPYWRHFETFHVLQQPTYASKYPPGQGLLLALGGLLGHPIVGMWLGIAALAGATTWMLRAFFGAGWSVFGGLLVAFRFGLPNYWSQGYWGGSLAALGGVLVFGSLPRLLKTPRLDTAIVFGSGLSLLALTRPFEGLLMGAACAMGLALGLARARRSTKEDVWASVRPIALGTGAALLVGLGFLGLYNQAVTGSAWRLPYQVYSEQYASTPQFVWQERGPMPIYHQEILFRFWRNVALRFDLLQSPELFLKTNLWRASYGWRFFVGWSLTLPLIAAVASGRRRWLAFCGVLTAAIVAVIWGYQSFHPHYLAPLVGPLIFVIVAGSERLADWLPGRRAVLLLMLALLGAEFGERLLRKDPGLQLVDQLVAPKIRGELENELIGLGGKHLVLIRISSKATVHDAWTVNYADIDGQSVILAHDLASAERPDANQGLMTYYADRSVWHLHIPEDPRRFRLIHLRDPMSRPSTVSGDHRP